MSIFYLWLILVILSQIYDLSKMKLKYCGTHFNSPEVQPTCERIDQSFGATKPAQFDEKHHMFVLSFLGITFLFPVDHQYEVFVFYSNPLSAMLLVRHIYKTFLWHIFTIT